MARWKRMKTGQKTFSVSRHPFPALFYPGGCAILNGVNKKLCLLICFLMLAGAGAVWLQADTNLPRSVCKVGQIATVALPEGGTEFPPLDVSFVWNPADLPTRSLLLATDEEPRLLQRVPAVPLRLRTDGRQIAVESDTDFRAEEELWEQLGFCYKERTLPPTLLRMPDGSVHVQYHLLLQMEMMSRSLFQPNEHVFALTELVIDPIDGTVDAVTPDCDDAVTERAFPVRRICCAQNDPPLPARFCGTETEQSLQRYLYLVVSMHNAESARRLLPAVIARGQKLVDAACDTEQDFPDCWGEAADTARLNHRRILPYLLRLRELDCFGLPELADYLNSPLFARLFGESWTSPNEAFPPPNDK